MSRLTEKEKTALLGKLQAQRRELEKEKIYKDLQEFIGLPDKEKEKRYHAWDQYYKDVRSTTTYAMYEEGKIALLEKNLVRVREIGKEARRMREEGLTPELPKPPFTDPWEFNNSSVMKALHEVNSRIKLLVSEGIDIEDLGF